MSWVQFPSGAPIQLTLRSAECAGNGQGRFCGRSGEILGISKCREVNRPRESGLYSYVIFSCGVSLPKMRDFNAGMMELADVADSKSVGSNTVLVQVPLPAPIIPYHNGSYVSFLVDRRERLATQRDLYRSVAKRLRHRTLTPASCVRSTPLLPYGGIVELA